MMDPVLVSTAAQVVAIVASTWGRDRVPSKSSRKSPSMAFTGTKDDDDSPARRVSIDHGNQIISELSPRVVETGGLLPSSLTGKTFFLVEKGEIMVLKKESLCGSSALYPSPDVLKLTCHYSFLKKRPAIILRN